MVGRFPVVWLGVVVTAFTLAGCALLDDILPTSASEEESQTDSSSSSSTSSSSPESATTYPAPASGVQAPTIASPEPGSEVTATQPMLTVGNASTQADSSITYTFDVATDSDFTQMVASAAGVQQGSNGQTSWKVTEELVPGRYFWRSKARAGLFKSPFSSVADFTVVEAAPEPVPTDGNTEVFDPLTNGFTIGKKRGGQFTPRGWKVTDRSDYIRYEVKPVASGFVEWDNLGLRPDNLAHNHFMLFGMWDPSRGDYRVNPFRVHLQKLDDRHLPPYIRLRWIANREEHDEGYNFQNWDPEKTYHWRIEWGPGEGSNVARVLLNGQVIIRQPYYRTYKPEVWWVELGIAERQETVVGAIFSNLQIGKR